jgi:hypothetical protein
MELIKSPAGGGLDLRKWAAVRAHDRSVDTNKYRLSIAIGVASGMAFLHDRGYIHADLKPGNVRESCATFSALRHWQSFDGTEGPPPQLEVVFLVAFTPVQGDPSLCLVSIRSACERMPVT